MRGSLALVGSGEYLPAMADFDRYTCLASNSQELA